MFIELYPNILKTITFSGGGSLEGRRWFPKRKEVVPCREGGGSLKGNTYTEITTNTTTSLCRKNDSVQPKQIQKRERCKHEVNKKALPDENNEFQSSIHDVLNDKEHEISQSMVEIWNELIGTDGRKIKLTESRKRILLNRYRSEFSENMNSWKEFCLNIASSKFLMGEITKFKASIDWALKPESIQRISEGDYGVGDRNCAVEHPEINEDKLINEIQASPSSDIQKRIRLALLSMVGAKSFISWFKDLDVDLAEEDNVTIKARTSFIRDYWCQNFEPQISKAVRLAFPSVRQLDITTAG